MSSYNVIISTSEATVVAEYTPDLNRSADYQSEAALEREFIEQLKSQEYEFVKIKNEAELVENLRRQLELLNEYTFSDNEWQRFFTESIASASEGIVEKTRKMWADHVQILKRDDGTTKNISLIDKTRVHNNRLQVLNQYEEKEGARHTRYDVTILVNGLPLVHVELKRRGVAIKEAFNQIDRYQRESFWAASGLYEYIQIFVISNGTYTKYYSNTTRDHHIKDSATSRRRGKKTSNSFEFTSFWADANNKTIPDLVDFTKTFFARHSLLNILTRYCVFTSEDLLLVMRPYQIAATERILNRIEVSSNYKKTGTLEAGGYIWHTTGSGKTLTSFKVAQLATGLTDIEKVIFVVDRKDLDYQTMKEYDRFEKGAANSNTSTKILQKQLENPDAKIIITTIQKLDVFISKNKIHDIYKQHIVLVFDECHRSQFGDMHKRITKNFKNYHIFGFTGTPIFASNATSGGNPLLKTTEQAFGDKLHTYTIVDAINDNNVLPFRIDFIDTIKSSEKIVDKKVRAIDTENALLSSKRIELVASYILEHFNQKTYRNLNRSHFTHRIIQNVNKVAVSKYNKVEEVRINERVNGFNSIFATSSIEAAKKYYSEFKRLQANLPDAGKIKIGLIFSFAQNEELDGIYDENNENVDGLDQSSRDFLDDAIKDYNGYFKTNYDSSSEKFQNYYKDLSMRVKNQELDMLIVVNMFLTGFDATTLNTLWVDKNLRQHGLVQAFSRTNRILNSVKTFGNIICFRNLEQETEEAIALFGDKEAGGVVLLKAYNDYYNGYEENGEHKSGYVELITQLGLMFPLGNDIISEQAKKNFIKLFGAILRLKNILTAFDEFSGNEILSQRDFQDYQSIYIDLYQEFRSAENTEKESINDDIIFEIELIKQIEVNIDYILILVEKYHDSNCTDKSILLSIDKAINSSIELRSKKELIESFINQVNASSEVEDDWKTFVVEQKEKDLDIIIEEERLKPEETNKFISDALRDGIIKTTGLDIDKILPPISRFSKDNNRAIKKQTVIEKLSAFFESTSDFFNVFKNKKRSLNKLMFRLLFL